MNSNPHDFFHTVLENISYHVVYDANLHEAIDFAAANGFSGIQIALEVPRFSPERFSSGNRQSLKDHARQTGIRIALHGPDDVTSLFVSHPALKRGIHDYYADVFLFAQEIGASMVTIHLGQPVRFSQDSDSAVSPIPYEDQAFYEAQLSKNLEWLCLKCPKEILLCVENYHLNPLILSVLRGLLQSGKINLCWDIAKMFSRNLEKNQALEDFFIEHIQSVKQCHLHDVVHGFHAHQVIGSGELNFIEFLIKLQRAQVIDYCIEVRPRDKALESLRNLKAMLVNYNEQMQQWRNTGLTEADDEIQALNDLQTTLTAQGQLPDASLAIRRQITYLEPTHFLFFENVENIFHNIGENQPAHATWQCMTINPEQKNRVLSYLECLKEWLNPAEPDIRNSDEYVKIQALLGSPGEIKKLLVRRLLQRVNFVLERTSVNAPVQNQELPTDRFGGFTDSDIPAVLALQRQLATLLPDARQFEQHICENYICHHKYLRHLDIILENIRLEKWNINRRVKGTDGIFRARKTQHSIQALTAWLNQEMIEPEAEFVPLVALLGEKTSVKEWLALSLQKTLSVFEGIMKEISG